jgi:hypothetical protein
MSNVQPTSNISQIFGKDKFSSLCELSFPKLLVCIFEVKIFSPVQFSSVQSILLVSTLIIFPEQNRECIYYFLNKNIGRSIELSIIGLKINVINIIVIIIIIIMARFPLLT